MEVLEYMRDSVDQQHEGSLSLVVIYSGGSLTWRNLGKRFVVQTLRYEGSILQPLAVLLRHFIGAKALP